MPATRFELVSPPVGHADLVYGPAKGCAHTTMAGAANLLSWERDMLTSALYQLLLLIWNVVVEQSCGVSISEHHITVSEVKR
jgi:hypothetical protein